MSRAMGETLYATRPKDRKLAEKLWEAFNVGKQPAVETRDPYLRMLLSDWRRCRSLGVSSNMKHGVLLSKDEYAKALAGSRLLLERAEPVLSQAQRYLSGVPGILILTDGDGTILRVVGDPSVRSKADRMSNIVEGSRWSEDVSGTNGIGTAIKKKAPVHIYSSEHYCEGWHCWTCAATPIIDPLGEAVMGVVDFTTVEVDYRDSSVALTYGLAGQIQKELLVQLDRDHAELIRHFADYAARFPSDHVRVLDRLGHVVRSSPVMGSPERGEPDAQLLGPPAEVQELRSREGGEAIGSLIIARRRHRAKGPVHAPRRSDSSVRSFGGFLTGDEDLKRTLERLGRVLATELGILLIGETGTGKEVIARYVHDESNRRHGPFVPVNCGAISKELFESRFFGYERGAFTGADPKGRQGLFEQARGGTLFLDEIGELPLDMQTGLLRVLESNKFRRIGAEKETDADCRIVAATNRPLAQAIEEGLFRPDLYYRLGVFTIHIPPLRERKTDIPVLIDHLVEAFCEGNRVPPKTMTKEALQFLVDQPWPGNGRQLRNVISSAMVCSEDPITIDDLSQDFGGAPSLPQETGTIRAQEREMILTALRKYRSVSKVCRQLGISRSTIYRRFQAFGIDQGEYLD
ncbi:MAG: sigma-54-dependent Fis family transcriptional regulator [Proteobacteria bacterium]|nr:sigma-54-dependent Fis family transcriptional regulator [Pseudomonadota bacterium]